MHKCSTCCESRMHLDFDENKTVFLLYYIFFMDSKQWISATFWRGDAAT